MAYFLDLTTLPRSPVVHR